MNVAIQGIKGSFHHLVANEYFGESITIEECLTFSEMPELLKTNVVDAAVMAIENSNIGDILSNYSLIDKNNLNIAGEYYLAMEHNLMALKGQTINDITEVWSHPIAIQECEVFFRNYPNIKLFEEKDTATAAKAIAEKKLKNIAAIASVKSAEIYNLDILEPNIHDNLNLTRFFILTKKREHQPDDYLNNKASIKFTTKLKLDNLAEILNVCRDYKLQLNKIQSFPNQKRPWEYSFFMDFLFNDYHQYCKALLELQNRVQELKILGEYKENNPINLDKKMTA